MTDAHEDISVHESWRQFQAFWYDYARPIAPAKHSAKKARTPISRSATYFALLMCMLFFAGLSTAGVLIVRDGCLQSGGQPTIAWGIYAPKICEVSPER